MSQIYAAAPPSFKSKDEEIEWLRYRVEELETLLGTAGPAVDGVRAMFRLTNQESKLLGLLAERAKYGQSVTKDMALRALYFERPDADLPEEKIVDVFICKLRKKLPPTIRIETNRGNGYFLSGESRLMLELLIADHRASQGFPPNAEKPKDKVA